MDQMIERVCNACGARCPDDAPDPCLGMLPGVSAACCGHGDPGGAYVLYSDGRTQYGNFDNQRTKSEKTGKRIVLDGLPRRDWKDIGYTAVAAVAGYHVEFQVYEISGEYEDGTVCWPRDGGNSNMDAADDIAGAEVYFHGSVKWDGCSNWWFDEQERGVMLHACSRENLTAIGEAMARCWDWTAEILPTAHADLFERKAAQS